MYPAIAGQSGVVVDVFRDPSVTRSVFFLSCSLVRKRTWLLKTLSRANPLYYEPSGETNVKKMYACTEFKRHLL